MLTVTKSERKDNQKGKWLVLDYVNDKGESKQANIFGSTPSGKKIIEETFKGPGKYEASWVQEGKYFNLASLELVGTATPSSNGHSESVSNQTPKPIGRAEVAIAVLEATSRIYYGKGDDRGVVCDAAPLLARTLMQECANFINPKAPEAKQESQLKLPVEGA